MSLQDQIDALPKWPRCAQLTFMLPGRPKSVTRWENDEEALDAALARLALLRIWIASHPHQQGCPWRGLTRDSQGLLPDCTCGRDALLAALEPPR